MTTAPDQIRTDRVRVLLFMKRKDGSTPEEFSEYWRTTHAKLFMTLDIVKSNVLKYEQVRAGPLRLFFPKCLCQILQAHTDSKWLSVPSTAMGLTASEWDGVLILDGESFEKLFAVFGSEEYQRVVAPDEANFVDRAKCQLLPVGLVTVIE
ncbi:hypothetical protein C0991_004652 [Blastosporella zonata]|nr:hypothetical protein C0991_004652 [Blastosporella zonata]